MSKKTSRLKGIPRSNVTDRDSAAEADVCLALSGLHLLRGSRSQGGSRPSGEIALGWYVAAPSAPSGPIVDGSVRLSYQCALHRTKQAFLFCPDPVNG